LVWALSTVLVGWDIFSPLWVNFDIVIHQLVSEEKVLISPFGRSHGAFKLQGTDQGFCSSKLFRTIPGINIVEIGISRNCLKLLDVSHGISLEFGWEEGMNI